MSEINSIGLKNLIFEVESVCSIKQNLQLKDIFDWCKYLCLDKKHIFKKNKVVKHYRHCTFKKCICNDLDKNLLSMVDILLKIKEHNEME